MMGHRNNHGLQPRAFTLVELLATISVLGLSVAAALPILSAVSSGGMRAEAIATERQDASAGIQRLAALLRSSGDPSHASTMLTSMKPTEFRLADGSGVELKRGALLERDTRGRTHPLVRGVTRFQIAYLRDDGITIATTAAEVHCVDLWVDTEHTRCATRVFLRGRMGLP